MPKSEYPTRLSPPEEKEWRRIHYTPKEHLKWVHDGEWEKEFERDINEGYTFYSLYPRSEHYKRIMRDWWGGKHTGKVISTICCIKAPKNGKKESWVEPLATIHKAFWNCLSTVLHNVYPNTSKAMMKRCKPIHTAVAELYWRDLKNEWKRGTPEDWTEKLNKILEWLEADENRATSLDGGVGSAHEIARKLKENIWEILGSSQHGAAL